MMTQAVSTYTQLNVQRRKQKFKQTKTHKAKQHSPWSSHVLGESSAVCLTS